jgi:hypothetical protein
MEQEHQEQIEKTIAGMKCSKDFECHKSEFGNLCEANDIGVSGYIDCLEGNLCTCRFRIHFAGGYLCHCPLRVFIAKNLKTVS